MRTTLLRASAAVAIALLVGCAAGADDQTGEGGSSGSNGVAGSTGIAGHGVAGQGVAGQGVAGQGVAGQGVAGQGVAGEGAAGQGVAGQGVAGEGVAGQGVAGAAGANAGHGGASAGGSGGGAAGRGGAAGGAAGGPAGGSSGAYNPCPTNGDPCRILPVGDSITFGINQEGSYRIELFHKATMAMQKITYTGTLQNGPQTVDGVTFPRRYEATSGITIDGISSQITKNNTLNMPSDIIIVHIGTNDMYMSNPDGAPMRLGTLLDKLIAGMPNALIVVTKIIPLPSGKAAVDKYNAAIPGIIKTRVDAGKHLMLVDLNASFPSGDLSSDNVHPNVAGYAWMGDRLYDAIGGLFHKP